MEIEQLQNIEETLSAKQKEKLNALIEELHNLK